MIMKFKFIIWLLRQPIQTDETPIQINETFTSSSLCISISILWMSSLILFDVADLFCALHWPRQTSKRRKMPRENKGKKLSSSPPAWGRSEPVAAWAWGSMHACSLVLCTTHTQSTAVIKPTDFMTKSGIDCGQNITIGVTSYKVWR